MPPSFELPEDWQDPSLVLNEDDRTLIGVGGSAGEIMAHVNRVLKMSGNTRAVQDAYRREAMSGDYANLLTASMAYCGF